nr:uncharacterized protein LOC105729790 [Aotus nancymaae]
MVHSALEPFQTDYEKEDSGEEGEYNWDEEIKDNPVKKKERINEEKEGVCPSVLPQHFTEEWPDPPDIPLLDESEAVSKVKLAAPVAVYTPSTAVTGSVQAGIQQARSKDRDLEAWQFPAVIYPPNQQEEFQPLPGPAISQLQL